MTTREPTMGSDELQLAADRLRLVAGSAGAIPLHRMKTLLECELAEFGCCLDDVFAAEEADDSRLETDKPHLVPAIRKLREQRTALGAEAQSLFARAAAEADPRLLGPEVTAMLDRVAKHLASKEATTLRDVFDDLGVGD